MVMACANTVSKKVETDIATQNDINSRQSLNTGLNVISRSKNLTDVQKAELIDLMDKTRMKMNDIRRNEAHAKSSFFKYLADGEIDDAHIKAYRKELMNLEKQKMDLMFSNLKTTRKILGKKLASEKDLSELQEMYQIHSDVH